MSMNTDFLYCCYELEDSRLQPPYNSEDARELASKLRLKQFVSGLPLTGITDECQRCSDSMEDAILTYHIGSVLDPRLHDSEDRIEAQLRVITGIERRDVQIACLEFITDRTKGAIGKMIPGSQRSDMRATLMKVERTLDYLCRLDKEADEPDQNNANWTRSEQIALMDMYGLIDMVYEKTKSKEDAYKIISIISGMPKDSAKHNVLSLNPQSEISRAKYNADKAKSEVEKKLKRLSIQ